MTRNRCLGIVCGTLLLVSSTAAFAPRAAGAQASAPTAAQTAAVRASPDLVHALSKEIGATPEQSAGAAGALFQVAKSRLKADEFSQVSKAVPGMTSLLKAAPSGGGSANPLHAVSKVVPGSTSGLAGAVSAFSKLGLGPDMVTKAVPVLTSFVTKSGGANVGNLLAGVLK